MTLDLRFSMEVNSVHHGMACFRLRRSERDLRAMPLLGFSVEPC